MQRLGFIDFPKPSVLYGMDTDHLDHQAVERLFEVRVICSNSTGGMFPIGSSSRRLLNQSTQSRVANSTCSTLRQGPQPGGVSEAPFSEAQFKTLKYHPSFPGRFEDQGQAKTFCRSFFRWSNAEHRAVGPATTRPWGNGDQHDRTDKAFRIGEPEAHKYAPGGAISPGLEKTFTCTGCRPPQYWRQQPSTVHRIGVAPENA